MPVPPTIGHHPARPRKEPKNTDHLVPHANNLLKIAGKAAWGMTKLLVGVAVRIPGWFVRETKKHWDHPRKPNNSNNQ